MAILLATCASVQADPAETSFGSLLINDARIRATAPGAKVGAGYLSVMNMGDQADRLIAVTASFAKNSEIHEMKMEEDIAKMRPLESGLEIPAGKSVELRPGGLHIMFMNLQQQLQAGATYSIILHFERQGNVDVPFEVLTDPGNMHSDDHKNHDEHGHNGDQSQNQQQHRNEPY